MLSLSLYYFEIAKSTLQLYKNPYGLAFFNKLDIVENYQDRCNFKSRLAMYLQS